MSMNFSLLVLDCFGVCISSELLDFSGEVNTVDTVDYTHHESSRQTKYNNTGFLDGTRLPGNVCSVIYLRLFLRSVTQLLNLAYEQASNCQLTGTGIGAMRVIQQYPSLSYIVCTCSVAALTC